MNFKPYLKGLTKNFLGSHLNGHYIQLRASTGRKLEDEVEYQLFEEDNQAVVVLGDYGTGKTSMCLKLC